MCMESYGFGLRFLNIFYANTREESSVGEWVSRSVGEG